MGWGHASCTSMQAYDSQREDKAMDDVNNGQRDDGDEGRPLNEPITRRNLLKLFGMGGLGVTGLWALGARPWKPVQAASETRQVLVANAQGMIIGQPTRCVGCRRCELACTEFNDGKAQPSIARIKVGRNYNFGPAGAQLGFWRGEGAFGNHRIIQDTCRQCPHPVACQLACPNAAIEVVPPVNARVVNVDKCTGCRICQRACPWDMTSFDEELNKATKCTLCAGQPECVQACPSGALQYVPWEDMTKLIPARVTIPAYIGIPDSVKSTCTQCHTQS
jgi:Fe-S-cluster-containing dehydrogenase component